MEEKIKIKPGEGKRLRLEDGTIVAFEGTEVTRSTYINRRIAAGDAVIVKEVNEIPPQRKRKD